MSPPRATRVISQGATRFATLAKGLGPDVESFSGSKDLLKESQVVLTSREPVESVQKAATEVRTLVPQLLQSLGNVASALGSPGVEGMTRHLERFEVAGMRVTQDMQALASGIDDVGTIVSDEG